MTAQEQYRRMLNECVTPALRERGWSGGSGKYYLTSPEGHLGSLHLSGSRARSSKDARAFHLHVGVVSRYLRQVYEISGLEHPKKPSIALDHDWFREVASFTISAEDDPLDLGAFVVTMLDSQAIPLVLDSLEDAGLRRAVDRCPVGVGNGGARLLLEIAEGNLKEAHRRLERLEALKGPDDELVVYARSRLRRGVV